MNIWLKQRNGGYLNAGNFIRLVSVLDSGVWWVQADGRYLDGSYATEALAEAAAQRLVNGVTLADVTA